MRTLLAALPAVGCMLMIPAMLWMARGTRDRSNRDPNATRAREVAELRDEVTSLRSELGSDDVDAPRA